jgi:uncharacterized membrane protein YedE/YeeE
MGTAMSIPAQVVWGGFAIAFIFGAVANKTNFCTMGAISDVVNMGHWGRVRMWVLAVAVAIVATGTLHLSGQIDIAKAGVQRPVLPWLSLGLGGALFGVGMTLAGGCANKNLIRVGGGSVRSLVVLVFMGIASYMTLKGLFGQWRATWLDPVAIRLDAAGWPDQGLGTAVARLSGLDARSAQMAAMAVVVLALLAFAFKDKRFRGNAQQTVGGVVLGLLVAAGWYVTGHLGYGENPETLETVFQGTNSRTLESMSFVGPTAYGLELLMLWTDQSLHATFGIASVLGVLLGSAVVALATGSFRWECFSSVGDLRSQLIGAVLMGFGGVTALGCTIGQGMSGLSTLALGSVLALAGIVAGSVAMLKFTIWQAEREA